ncbi:MAG: hypothetical protein JSR37_00890 [Verrucomicrobia bacterium]|nr:hypothetical protein [Verrucomicrobiota bacterium]MBS0637482.1 hypothetical protein [Verrucomicrobiota bacterium]
MHYVTTAVEQALGTLNLYHPQKPEQQLDPISTICMLSLRSLDAFKGLRPGVSNHWLSFSTGPIRGANHESSNDLQYVKQTLRLFVKGWVAKDNETLAKIAAAAQRGLALLWADYEAQKLNDVDTCDVCLKILVSWLVPPPPVQTIRLPPLGAHYLPEQKEIDALTEQKKKLCENARQFVAKHAGKDAFSADLIKQLIDQYDGQPVTLQQVPEGLQDRERLIVNQANGEWTKEKLAVFESLLQAKNIAALVAVLEEHRPVTK